MGKIISAGGGSIEDYIGDELMALFGLDDSPNACFRAVSAGLGMMEDIARNRQHFRRYLWDQLSNWRRHLLK